jgi:hypothetical protein
MFFQVGLRARRDFGVNGISSVNGVKGVSGVSGVNSMLSQRQLRLKVQTPSDLAVIGMFFQVSLRARHDFGVNSANGVSASTARYSR